MTKSRTGTGNARKLVTIGALAALAAAGVVVELNRRSRREGVTRILISLGGTNARGGVLPLRR